jgi:hypothetical protein
MDGQLLMHYFTIYSINLKFIYLNVCHNLKILSKKRVCIQRPGSSQD